MVVAETIAGLSAIKTAFNMAQGLQHIHDTVGRDRAVIELQKEILAAQATQTTLIDTISELKRRVAELEAWDADKARYKLHQIQTGVLVYALKEGMEGGEQPHYLCPTCYNRGKKSLLQKETLAVGRVPIQVCHDCGTELIENGMRQEPRQRRR